MHGFREIRFRTVISGKASVRVLRLQLLRSGNVSNERYHGWQSTSQHPNVGDLYSGWFSTGFCNSNVEASVNGCSYENGVHGIATMSKGRTVVNNTTLARNNAREANTEQCGQKGNGGGIFLNGGTIIWNSGTICENQADRGAPFI